MFLPSAHWPQACLRDGKQSMNNRFLSPAPAYNDSFSVIHFEMHIAKIMSGSKYPIYMKRTAQSKKNRRTDILPTIFSRANNHIHSILLAANHPLKQVSVSSCLLLQNSHNLQKTP